MGRPSFSEIQRAKEKAEINGQWGVVEQLNKLKHQKHAELADFDDPGIVESSSSSSNGFSFDLPQSTAEKYTDRSLNSVSPSDYSNKCKHCGAKPFSEGPHQDKSCPRYQAALALSTEPAHRFGCKHCDAQPFVAGVHHRRDCPRRIEEHVKTGVSGKNYGYSTKCKHCGVKPFSQGPHHESSCKRCWSYSAYSTKLAHKYDCKECGARPFVAGPHHEGSCKRHFR